MTQDISQQKYDRCEKLARKRNYLPVLVARHIKTERKEHRMDGFFLPT